jgi:hypothetical protein
VNRFKKSLKSIYKPYSDGTHESHHRIWRFDCRHANASLHLLGKPHLASRGTRRTRFASQRQQAENCVCVAAESESVDKGLNWLQRSCMLLRRRLERGNMRIRCLCYYSIYPDRQHWYLGWTDCCDRFIVIKRSWEKGALVGQKQTQFEFSVQVFAAHAIDRSYALKSVFWT